MKVKILGTRGEIKPSSPYHSRHSGVLINNELLVDLGEKEFLKYSPRWVIISHLHPDHAYFVRKKENSSKLDIKAQIYAPERYGNIDLTILEPEQLLKINSYKIRTIPTIHSKTVETFAYTVKHKDSKILYTGDLVWLEKKYHHYLTDLNLVIMEASFLQEGGFVQRDEENTLWGHTGIPNLIRLFSDFTDKMLILHFGSWFYELGAKEARKELKKLGKKDGVRILVGYDGQVLEV
ncbi:MAG: MBL fold metallo-hydrolase [Patescibacteria group bacterium]